MLDGGWFNIIVFLIILFSVEVDIFLECLFDIYLIVFSILFIFWLVFVEINMIGVYIINGNFFFIFFV